MWHFLYKLASPKSFYAMSASWGRVFALLTCILLPTALIWGLFIAPPDYQQGDAYRIIYIHVPAAFLSMALYGWMAFLAVLLLVWRIKLAGLIMMEIAKIGAGMTALALMTGSIWGRPMWGSWWVWDARLTSELILLFFYFAIMAVFRLFSQQQTGEKMASVLILVGLVDLPVIHYSVYWWNTLHQGATLSAFSTPKIAAPMLLPLLLSLAGFFCFSLYVIIQRARYTLLDREKKQHWVREIIKGEAS